MRVLLGFASRVDALNAGVGAAVRWLVLAAVLVSAGNAIVRKSMRWSSNALLEAQWYLFAAVFLLCAGYALLRNQHVRIDVLSSRLSARTRNWIDVVGIALVLVPFCVLLIGMSWPLVVDAWRSGEMSSNAGGLVRWPVYALLPAGAALLLLQGLSELVKRVAFLRGLHEDPLADAASAEPARQQALPAKQSDGAGA